MGLVKITERDFKGKKMKLLKETDNGLLKFGNLDAVAGNTLAGMMGIEHSKVMRTIKRVMKSEEKRKKDTSTNGIISKSHTPQVDSEILQFTAIFKPYEYKTERGRLYNTFIMNEDALYLVIANSQSDKAHEMKVWFKSEFNKMRIEREAREMIREDTKTLHDTLKPLSDALKEMYPESKKGGLLYNHIHKKVNKAVLGKGTGTDRDILSVDDINRLDMMEYNLKTLLDEWRPYNPMAVRGSVFKWIEGKAS
jgi:phage regulator Rha-like protein